ncbi:MAG: hypothetical protein IJ066_04655 [Bacteroidaceae bacterium]|nr:hypothetical protein [Bacteroidaceae bacterium]
MRKEFLNIGIAVAMRRSARCLRAAGEKPVMQKKYISNICLNNFFYHMTKQQYSDIMDVHRHLSISMMDLLSLNWNEFPWAKDIYYELDSSFRRLTIFIDDLRAEIAGQAIKAQNDGCPS